MKKCRGSMTITMCLVFSILLSLLLSGIQLARTQAGRIQAMHAADTMIYSTLMPATEAVKLILPLSSGKWNLL